MKADGVAKRDEDGVGHYHYASGYAHETCTHYPDLCGQQFLLVHQESYILDRYKEPEKKDGNQSPQILSNIPVLS